MELEWQPPPLHRHLSTIGIGPVFVCSPPTQPPVDDDTKRNINVDDDVDDVHQPSHQNEILTWEIVGDIKSSPEDFIVREIGWAPNSTSLPSISMGTDDNSEESAITIQKNANGYSYRRKPGWHRCIAGLECNHHTSEQSSSGVYVGGRDDDNNNDTKDTSNIMQKSDASCVQKKLDSCSHSASEKVPDNSHAEFIPEQSKPESTCLVASKHEEDKDMESTNDPVDELRRILIACHSDNNPNAHETKEQQSEADRILQQLGDLQNLALDEIESTNLMKKDENETDKSKIVWIPTANLFNNSSDVMNGKEDWKLLHRNIRIVFPLLRTESSSAGPFFVANASGNEDEGATHVDKSDPVNKSCVCCVIDQSFFSIASCLANPREDLPLLYKFRSSGPVPALGGDGNRGRCGPNNRKGGKNNKRKCAKGKGPGDETTVANNVTQGIVLLRLRPDLPRDERRVIHQALTSSTRRREFDTSTRHDVQLDYNDKDSNEKTTAIVVQWSRNALQASQKKRKRGEVSSTNSNTKKSSDITAIWSVLRKYQCEHQVALTNVVRELGCRTGDVGLAGIKDMQAITYQFCTVRNVDLSRVKRANKSLGKRINLSNFIHVQGADALLDRGKLIGNYFEIILRNLKQVKRLQIEGDEPWKERTVQLHASHLDAMVKRIANCGFINFYGEQRLGEPGSTDYVGVRSFDIGRAFLQHDFANAIDLIMTGRSHNMYNPGTEEMKARSVWKTSGGDARATLKAFPKNRSVMVRERDIMKGLVRYSDALEAIRCVPHSIRMFWIHSYQSFVWNRVASERVKRWGLVPVVGDLFTKEADSSGDDEEKNGSAAVQLVDDPSTVDISQIVLPLPGYNIQYPTNEIGDLYKEVLRKDGIELVSKGTIAEATAKGSYRKLIQRASNLKWDDVSEIDESKHKASDHPVISSAKLSFELESGCYATMMLRELMLTTMSRKDYKLKSSNCEEA